MLLRLEPGTVVGGVYRVVRPLSEGGMGAVYVAEQVTTKKERALKIMRAELVLSDKMQERFKQEAQIGSRIDSEHVVEVIDAGIDPQMAVPWLAMELLRGETLASMIDTHGALSHRSVKELFGQLCHAIAAAHDAGIVHRDLKPENIFLAVARREGVPYTLKVLDFGIAKLLSEVGTRSTGALGTPLFMPPEQMTPGRSITPAADVWALGLIAFYVLTGKHYWYAGNQDPSSAMMLLNEVTNLPIVPASERAREHGCAAALPRGFDDFFARAVNRSIEARLPDARALRAALEPLLQGSENPDGHVPQVRARTPANDALSTDPTVLGGPAAMTPPPAGSAALKSAAFTETSLARGASTPKAPARFKSWVVVAGGGAAAAALALAFLVQSGSNQSRSDLARKSLPAETHDDSDDAKATGRATGRASAMATQPASSASAPIATSFATTAPIDRAHASILTLANAGKLDAAHEEIDVLPTGSPLRQDERTRAIVTSWVSSKTAASKAAANAHAMRTLLVDVAASSAVMPEERTRALATLRALETWPTSIGAEKKRLVVVAVEPASADQETRDLVRAEIVTELLSDPSVLVSFPDQPKSDRDGAIAKHSLRGYALIAHVREPQPGGQSIAVQVSGYPAIEMLGSGSHEQRTPAGRPRARLRAAATEAGKKALAIIGGRAQGNANPVVPPKRIIERHAGDPATQ